MVTRGSSATTIDITKSRNAGNASDITNPSTGVYCLTSASLTGFIGIQATPATTTARYITTGAGTGTGCAAGTTAWFRVFNNSGSASNLSTGDSVYLAFLN